MRIHISRAEILIAVIGTVLALGGYAGYQRLVREARQTDQRLSQFIATLEAKVTSSKGRLPFVTLSVSSEHKVTRTVIESELAKSITWVVTRNGETVLERNAQNETDY